MKTDTSISKIQVCTLCGARSFAQSIQLPIHPDKSDHPNIIQWEKVLEAEFGNNTGMTKK